MNIKTQIKLFFTGCVFEFDNDPDMPIHVIFNNFVFLVEVVGVGYDGSSISYKDDNVFFKEKSCFL